MFFSLRSSHCESVNSYVFSCVVTGNSFYFGVMLPIAGVLLFNFIILGMVMRSLSSTNRNMLKKQKNETRSQARIAFACSVLLGVSWVFGLLAVGDLRDVFQWLFTIFNSLQGLFIFIFYTLRNTEVQKEWKRVLKISRDNENSSSLHSDTYTRTPRTKSELTILGIIIIHIIINLYCIRVFPVMCVHVKIIFF